MGQTAIFWPVLALIAWTMIILTLIAVRRVRAARDGTATISDFQIGESGRVPTCAAVANRAFINLLEVPVLFYVLALVSFVVQSVTPVLVALAWGYVALRLVHSLVYLTYNRVIHRFVAFSASNLMIFLMIGNLAWSLASRAA